MPENRYETPRGIRRRLVVEGLLELTSPTHFGGHDPAEITDSPVARDRFSGRPILYGTTLAGLLRNALADRLSAPLEEEPKAVVRIFGADRCEDQSPLIVDDAVCINDEGADIRDGVAIDAETGVAEAKKKYDMEFLRPGAQFKLRLELLLDGTRDVEFLRYLATCMDALEQGDLRLGARSRKGFGRCMVREQIEEGREAPYCWRVWDFDMKSQEGLFRWMAFGDEDVAPPGWPRAASRTFATAGDMLKEVAQGSSIIRSAYREFSAELTMRVDASMLVRAYGEKSGDADSTHLTLQGKPVLPGTSLGGVMKARARKIVNTLAGDTGKARAERLMGELFGKDVVHGVEPLAGRVYVEEVPIRDGTTLRHTRVRIDRWTGGALEHLLFDADALFGGRLTAKLRVVLPKEEGRARAMTGLMLCVIKDLMTGDLPVGGEASIGRGRLVGEMGSLVYRENGTKERWNLGGREDRTFEVDRNPEGLQAFVDALSNYLNGRKSGGAP